MTNNDDFKASIRERLLAKGRIRDGLRTASRKPNRRIEGMAKWMIHGDRVPNANIQKLLSTASQIAATPLDKVDPRTRLIDVDHRWAKVLSTITREAGVKYTVDVKAPWSRRIVQVSLNRLYCSLAEAMGAPNALTHKTKDVNIGRLFDMSQAQDLGFTMKLVATGEEFKIDTPSELAVFMNQLLADKSPTKVARSIFSSVQTVESLRRFPEDHRLSSLLRVIDQFNVEMTAYDKRPEHVAGNLAR